MPSYFAGNWSDLNDKWFWAPNVFRDTTDRFVLQTTGEYLNETEAYTSGMLDLTASATSDPDKGCFSVRWKQDSPGQVFKGREAACDYDTTRRVLCQVTASLMIPPLVLHYTFHLHMSFSLLVLYAFTNGFTLFLSKKSFPAEPLNCTGTGTGGTARKKRSSADGLADSKLDSLLNPSKKSAAQSATDQARRTYRESFSSLNMTAAYNSMFDLLWYSQLPCFDVKKYTSAAKDQRCEVFSPSPFYLADPHGSSVLCFQVSSKDVLVEGPSHRLLCHIHYLSH